MQLEEYIIGGGSRLASAKGGGRWEAASNCRRSKLTAEGCHWVWGGEGQEQSYQGPRTATSRGEGESGWWSASGESSS